MDWLPHRIFRPRGWLLIGAGLLALFFAQVLGRRDLLTVSIFLLLLPVLASVGLRLFHPGFKVQRVFSPAFVETGMSATVILDVRGTSPGGGTARITEDLPPHLNRVPSFNYPNPVVPRSLLSRYEYTLRPTRRGLFTVGPLSAHFSDPFDVAFLRRNLDDGDQLTVAPAAVALPVTSLTGGRGMDGSRRTRQQANPSDDDVMTRDYRHGDPMRRVHWPATARHGRLMVRQEESVTTPEASLVLDRRMHAFGGSERLGRTFSALATSPHFEWAVVAAVSIATHLLDQGYALRVLDDQGQPGFLSSRSAPEPSEESYLGADGIITIAQSLAALELHAGPGEHAEMPLAEALADKLIQTRRRGPIIAILGTLSTADAIILASTSDASEGAFALVVCDYPDRLDAQLGILRRAGWRTMAVTPGDSLVDAWASVDDDDPLPTAAAPAGRHPLPGRTP
jgi:uncharacterized protein (DUF58 family)